MIIGLLFCFIVLYNRYEGVILSEISIIYELLKKLIAAVNKGKEKRFDEYIDDIFQNKFCLLFCEVMLYDGNERWSAI